MANPFKNISLLLKRSESQELNNCISIIAGYSVVTGSDSLMTGRTETLAVGFWEMQHTSKWMLCVKQTYFLSPWY